MSIPLISIIVPVYNVADYIEECIKSIVSQSHPSYELILINDGSTDDSGEICDRYAREYSSITVIHQQNQGVSIARNVGIDVAKGKWIAFVDGDDCLRPDALNNAARVLDDDVDCFILDTRRYDINGNIDYPCNFSDELNNKTVLAEELFYKHKYTRSVIWGCLYKREFIIKNNLKFLEGVINSEDVIYFAFVLYYAKKIHLSHIDFGLVNYREGSASRSSNEYITNKYIANFKLIEDEIKLRGIDYNNHGIFGAMVHNLVIGLCVRASETKSLSYKEIERMIRDTSLFPINSNNIPFPKIRVFLFNRSLRLLVFYHKCVLCIKKILK